MKHIYIAGPYRGKNAWVVAENIRRAERLAYDVSQFDGAVAICPHTMTANFHGTLTDKYWLEATLSLMERCDAVLVVPDWEASEGTKGEISRAKELGMPVLFSLRDVWLYVVPM